MSLRAFLRHPWVYGLGLALLVLLQLSPIKSWFLAHLRPGHILLVAFLVTYVITPEIEELALKLRALDHPDTRKHQESPVPLWGGLAVALGFILALVQNLAFPGELLAVLAGGALLVATGLLDDRFHLGAKTKLLVQIVCAVLVMNQGLRFTLLPETGVPAVLANQGLTLIWLVGITNAFNFLDGLDGLATGLAAIACLFFTLFAVATGQNELAYLAVALLGACAGFLVYNFRPARIYLGDTGSNSIGFVLACLAVLGWWSHGSPLISLAIPGLVLGLLIFDMVLTTALRFKNGQVRSVRQWLEFTGRDHVHHRLLALGATHRQAVLWLWLIAALLGLAAVGASRCGGSCTGAWVILAATGAAALTGLIALDILTSKKT